MGSGCNASFSSNVLRPTPDTSVVYTGPAIPALGICTNDTLSEVEAVILQQILNYSTAIGITVPDIDLTQCACFTQAIGCCGPSSCVSLTCILQAYLDCMCTMYADILVLTTKVDAMFDGPYDTKCLANVTSTSKLPDILQEVITELCVAETNISNLTTLVNTINSTLTTTIGTFLSTAIQSCQTDAVVKTGTGASFVATFAGFAPIGAILMYGGPITGRFDTSGLGLSPGPMCGWALCNGNTHNGVVTVDMRGYFPVGVNDGTMGGGAQQAEVDNSVNSGQAYPNGGRLDTSTGTPGEIKHLLTSGESGVAAASLSVNDPGHDHGIQYQHQERKIPHGGIDNYVDFSGTMSATTPWTEQPSGLYHPNTVGIGVAGTEPGKILPNKTGITVTQVTANAANKHENRPPFKALYFIQRVA